LGIPAERTIVNIDHYGNTSAASIPLALAEAADAGRLRDRDLVLVSGFGAGMTWGSALIRWGRP
jgi:3-oxoacyl-[acyl-carrier-protein] synthase III